MSTLKLCINCRFYAGPKSRVECLNFGNLKSEPDYVNGGIRKEGTYASARSVRIDSRLCGPEGVWFEPIETQEQVA